MGVSLYVIKESTFKPALPHTRGGVPIYVFKFSHWLTSSPHTWGCPYQTGKPATHSSPHTWGCPINAGNKIRPVTLPHTRGVSYRYHLYTVHPLFTRGVSIAVSRQVQDLFPTHVGCPAPIWGGPLGVLFPTHVGTPQCCLGLDIRKLFLTRGVSYRINEAIL